MHFFTPRTTSKVRVLIGEGKRLTYMNARNELQFGKGKRLNVTDQKLNTSTQEQACISFQHRQIFL